MHPSCAQQVLGLNEAFAKDDRSFKVRLGDWPGFAPCHWPGVAACPRAGMAWSARTFWQVNVGVGAYRTEEGKPLVLRVVREAEKRLLADDSRNKEYLPITGSPGARCCSWWRGGACGKLFAGSTCRESSMQAYPAPAGDAAVQCMLFSSLCKAAALFVHTWRQKLSQQPCSSRSSRRWLRARKSGEGAL